VKNVSILLGLDVSILFRLDSHIESIWDEGWLELVSQFAVYISLHLTNRTVPKMMYAPALIYYLRNATRIVAAPSGKMVVVDWLYAHATG